MDALTDSSSGMGLVSTEDDWQDIDSSNNSVSSGLPLTTVLRKRQRLTDISQTKAPPQLHLNPKKNPSVCAPLARSPNRPSLSHSSAAPNATQVFTVPESVRKQTENSTRSYVPQPGDPALRAAPRPTHEPLRPPRPHHLILSQPLQAANIYTPFPKKTLLPPSSTPTGEVLKTNTHSPARCQHRASRRGKPSSGIPTLSHACRETGRSTSAMVVEREAECLREASRG